MAELTLDHMAAGGIHDQLAGGFHRYAVDAIWLVPHFEKMLYDNALLARAYLQAFEATGAPRHAEVAASTLDYLVRELRLPHGGYASATDADTDGVEGSTFVWTPGEVRELLGDDAALVEALYDITPAGNFEGATVLSRVLELDEASTRSGVPAERLPELRRRMLEARALTAAARARRQGPRVLERHGAGGARRGRARARPPGPARGRRAVRGVPARARCPARTARSGAPIEQDAARSPDSWTTTRRSPRGCGSSTARRSIRAG